MDRESPGRSSQEALVRALARTADARRSRGRYSDASRLYRRALQLAEDVYGPGDRELAPILSGLAASEQALGHEKRADQLAKRAAVLSDDSLVAGPSPTASGDSD